MTDAAAAGSQGNAAAELAALASKAFANAGGVVANQAVEPKPAATQQPASQVVQPNTQQAAAPVADASKTTADVAKPAAIPEGKAPNTVLSEQPTNVVDPAKTKADVEAAAKTEPVIPAYKLSAISERLSQEHVADLEAFAKKHGMNEAQAKQVLAREDLRVAQAYDSNRERLMADPVLGGANIDQTIATTKSVLQLLPPEMRARIVNNPMANAPELHHFCRIVASLIPQEDISRRSAAAPVQKPMTVGEAWLTNPKIRA